MTKKLNVQKVTAALTRNMQNLMVCPPKGEQQVKITLGSNTRQHNCGARESTSLA